MLVYYDFQLDHVEEAKPGDLFARRDTHSDKIERRLHELIEDPLARLWHRVRKEGVKEVTDWSEIRAAHLIFLSQPARFVDHSRDAAIEQREIDDLLGMDDVYLDMLVGLQMKEYELRLFRMPREGSHPDSRTACLFYPQTGVIGFPVMEDPEKKASATVTGGFGIPLHPQILLTAIPRTVHEPWLAELRKMFQAFSVGFTDECRKVVIPATVADRYNRAELAVRIRILRGLAKNIVQLMARMRTLIDKTHRVAGLAP